MSQGSTATASDATSRFHAIFCDALERYHEKTKKNLVLHPLIADLQNCKRSSDVLAVLDNKYKVQEYIQSRSGDKTCEGWLDATFTVVASFSVALGEGIGMVNLQKSNHKSSALKHLFCRYSHLQKSFLLGLASFS